MLTTLSAYLSTKNQITCLLFFTYIYDLVRAGFIESRKRQLEILKQLMSHRENRQLTMMTTPIANYHLYARLSGSRPSLLQDTDAAPDSCHMMYLSGQPLNMPRYRHPFMQRSKQHFDDLAEIYQTNKQRHDGWPPDYPIDFIRRPHSQPSTTNTTMLTTLSARRTSHELGQTAKQPTIYESTIDDIDEFMLKELDESKAEAGCPLIEMPKLVRYYQYMSHCLVIASFIKYSCLVIFDNELFGSKQWFSCYLPGRTAILPQLSPGFSFVVLFYHVIYRFYLCIIRKSFQLDCFIFLLYDKKTIEAMQTKLCDKLLKTTNPLEANRIYALNRLFFVKIHLRDELEKVIYRVKTNRNSKHWLKLKQFFNYFVLFSLGNIAVWSIPLAVAIIHTVLSSENYGIIYGVCDSVIHTHKNNWSLLDGHQLIWFLCDLIDSGWLLFDTTNALVWPFSSMVICSQDLNYTIDELNETLANITARMNHSLDIISARYWSKQFHFTRTRHIAKMFKSIEVDILVLQGEVTRMLQQINQVDEFISKLSAFCIFVWIFTNLFVQIVSLNNNKLVMIDAVIQFMQVMALVALTLSFAYIAQVNTKTRRLYRGICNLVAIDPNHKTKSSWLWVLEYFNKVKPSYSLRLGPFTELTLANYLKGCSWLITGAVVTTNLFKYKYNIQD